MRMTKQVRDYAVTAVLNLRAAVHELEYLV